jgi:hypothetical protein
MKTNKRTPGFPGEDPGRRKVPTASVSLHAPCPDSYNGFLHHLLSLSTVMVS